jgi:hypothetical protein
MARFTINFNRHNTLERKNRRREKKISDITNDDKEEEGDERNSPRKELERKKNLTVNSTTVRRNLIIQW